MKLKFWMNDFIFDLFIFIGVFINNSDICNDSFFIGIFIYFIIREKVDVDFWSMVVDINNVYVDKSLIIKGRKFMVNCRDYNFVGFIRGKG